MSSLYGWTQLANRFPSLKFPYYLQFHPKPWVTAAAKSLQSCLTLCDPRDGSPPGSPVPGILQERILEWVAISFSNAWKWKVKVKLLSRVQLFETPWTAAHQAPLSVGFSRQEHWSGCHCQLLWLLVNCFSSFAAVLSVNFHFLSSHR